MLRAQFQNLLILILLIATALSAYLGEVIEAVAIGVIVGFAILLGFLQEYRAERALAALKQMAAPMARVLRGGRETEIPARDLVPGDVILLGAGDKVPADGRLIEEVNLRLNEAALTGESVPVEKVDEVLPGDMLPLAERRNMVYAGTAVTYGRGKALIVATGLQTEFGKITGLLKGVKASKTPLQENLDRVGRALAAAALAVVSLIVVLGLMRGASLMEMFMFGIALAVAVVPEALPAVVTISLALGVQRMAKRNALVRHLPAVETLGATTVILSDKTGTLTRDEMTARRLWVGGQEIAISGGGYTREGRFTRDGVAIRPALPVMECLRAAALCSDARLIEVDGGLEVKGDPTEAALVIAAAKAGLDAQALETCWPRVAEIPFSSERKRMTTLHRGRRGVIACSKGAPEVILASCTSGRAAYATVAMDEANRDAVREAAQAMAARALRVLAVAQKPNADIGDPECEMVFLGLIGLIDPPRAEAAAAIETCKAAGIRPVMITGDHPRTGAAVAEEIGLLRSGRVVTGAELETMSPRDLARSVAGIEVYARVSPEHKLRVVSAWQENGHIVAMTGDGVNDAPALKQADVGIAMGITGTEVSREAADMTLTDDNFASIVAAVEEGRAIFGNIKKYLMYLLSSNIGEIGLMAGATLAGLPLPLSAVQILYVNLATDGLPALALAVDPAEADAMRRPPRDPRAGIFTRPVVFLMLAGGLWSMLVNLGLFGWALASGRDPEHAMTLCFVSLVLIELVKAYNFRSERRSVFSRPFANRWLNLAVLWELLLLYLIVHVPFLQHALGTYRLSAEEWAIVTMTAASVAPLLELAKWLVRVGILGK